VEVSAEIKDRVYDTLIRLMAHHPFFATVLLYLQPKFTKNVPTMMVDLVNWDVWINPDFVQELDDDELEFVLCHEAMHVILADLRRRSNRDPKIWNIAMDYEINCILVQNGIGKLPPDGLYNHAYCRYSAEEIYDQLKDQLGAGVVNITLYKGPGDIYGIKATIPGVGGTIDVHMDIDEIRQKYGDTVADRIENKIKNVLARAEQAAKRAGTLPAGIPRIIEETFHPGIPWRVLLLRYIKTFAGRSDYTWYPPSKKYYTHGIYTPGLRSEYIELAVAIDSSGSVSDEEMSVFVGAVEELMDSLADFTIHLIVCDAEVHWYQKLIRGSKIDKSKIKGYGGTNFMPAFDYIKKKGIRPDLFIYLTDGFPVKWPEKPPPYPVLWVINNDRAKVPWGHVIRFTEYR